MQSKNASVRNYMNRQEGQQFEELIEQSLGIYKALGIAHISKTPEPMKVLSRGQNGKFMCCFKKKAEPDFKGVLAGGRCIIFDAKHTNSDRVQQSVVSDEQRDIFDSYSRLNALCYIVVSINMTDFYRVPWSVWSDMKRLFGHKYMSKTELEPYGIKIQRLLDGIELMGGIDNE